jgi:hypothetical protein
METKKQNGLLGRLYAATISRVKTVRANISECLSSQKIARRLIPMMMFVLSSMSVGALLLGSPCLSSSAAVDYSKPVQKLSYYWANVVSADNMSTVQNNWRQVTSYRNMPADADLSSFRLSAYATNNYGTDFDIWFTVIADDTGETIYNSGWKSSPIINEPVYMYRTYSRVRCVMRIRYNDSSGYSNPPSNAEFSGVNWVINYDYYVNYSDDNFPDGWTATTTAVNTDIPDTALTTTTYIDWDEQISGANGFFDTLRYDISTLFGIGDSWQSAVYVMNYINGKLPYVFAISAFCGMVGIAAWFLEK